MPPPRIDPPNTVGNEGNNKRTTRSLLARSVLGKGSHSILTSSWFPTWDGNLEINGNFESKL